MNLEKMQKQRIKIYKDYLRQQVQKHANQRKQQNNYQRKKQFVDINQLINRLNEDDIRRLQQRRNTAILLKEHNSGLSNLRKSHIYPEDPSQPSMPNSSFIDNLNKKQMQRINKNKQSYLNNWQQNQMQQNMKRNRQVRDRNFERQEQGKHMQRLKDMQRDSIKGYEDIKKKHQQDMRLYDMHSKLMRENEEYRIMAEKFTQCQEDIISRLKRNQSAQRKRNLKFNQDVLKHQMGQYNQRRSLERSQILQGQDIDSSIFKNLLHGSPNYKKQYGEQLRSQMSEMETRKVDEKFALKEKYKIGGIFGGEHGREREQQIRYVDRKMGLKKGDSQIIQNRKRDENLKRSNNVNNQQQQQNKKQSRYPIDQSVQYEPEQQKYQKREPEQQYHKKQSTNYSNMNQPQRQPTNLPMLNIGPSAILAVQPKQTNRTPRSSISQYPPNPYLKESPSNRYSHEKSYIPIAAGDPGAAYHYRNQDPSSNDKKLFRSFDLVTGQNRFYG